MFAGLAKGQRCAIVVIIVDLATLQTEKSFNLTG